MYYGNALSQCALLLLLSYSLMDTYSPEVDSKVAGVDKEILYTSMLTT